MSERAYRKDSKRLGHEKRISKELLTKRAYESEVEKLEAGCVRTGWTE